MIKTDDKKDMYEDIELKNVLKTFFNWEFESVSGEEKRFDFSSKLINDKNFIKVIEELYFTEYISKLELDNELFSKKLTSAQKVSNYHGHLLRLKLFYYCELKKCIDCIEKGKINYSHYKVNLPYFNTISSIFEFLILHSESKDYVLERAIILSKLWFMIFVIQSKLSEDRNLLSEDIFIGYRNSYKSIEDLFLKGGLALFTNHINEQSNIRIKGCQNSLLNFTSQKDLDIFSDGKRIDNFGELFQKEIEKHLSRFSTLERYAYNVDDKGINCYAKVAFEDTKYVTINGIEEENDDKNNGKNDSKKNHSKKDTIIDIIIKLLASDGSNVKYVKISDDTRYYFGDLENNPKMITYKDYSSFIKENKEMNRMFTCCERKLLAELRLENKNNSNIILATTKPPCRLCKREISLIENKHIKARSSNLKNSQLKRNVIKKMDKFAEEIYKFKQ